VGAAQAAPLAGGTHLHIAGELAAILVKFSTTFSQCIDTS
jgi:hypothetical protein